MGTPVVIVPSGGRAVTVSTNGFGLPVTEATNGYGIPVTEDPNGGGWAVVGITFGPDVTAPTITSSTAISWPENLAFTHTLTANEPVTWTKTGGVDQSLFTLSGSTLSMTAKNFESPVDFGANNTYVVQITATDTSANATIFSVTVTITDVDEIAPTITSASAINQVENSGFTHSLTANETVTWTKTGGADTALFTLAGSTLTMAAKDFEAPTDADANNTYVVQVTATDTAGNATNQTITVTVTNVDDVAPTITSLSALNLLDNVAFSHTLTANETVTWTKIGGADAALFTLAGSSLTMTAKDYETPIDADANNTYVVMVRATDTASNTTDQTITVTITDVDEVAPTITSVSAINLNENSALSHTLTANETVTWTKTGGADTALFSLAGSTLSMTAKDFEVPLDSGANNTYVVQVTATDTASNATNQTITVTIIDLAEGGAPSMDFSTAANSMYAVLLDDPF